MAAPAHRTRPGSTTSAGKTVPELVGPEGVFPALPPDPRILYVVSPRRPSLAELAELYTGQRGCSAANLEKRCRKEHWQERRRKYGDRMMEILERQVAVSRATRIAHDLKDYDRQKTIGRRLLAVAERCLDDAENEEIAAAVRALSLRAALESGDRASAILHRAIQGSAELTPETDDPYKRLLADAAAAAEAAQKDRDTRRQEALARAAATTPKPGAP